MTRSYTVTELTTAIRQRADIVNSQVCTDSEIMTLIDKAYCELYDLIVEKYQHYYISTTNLTTTSGTDTVALPADFYKMLGLDLQTGTDEWETVKPFNFNERNQVSKGFFNAQFRQDYKYSCQGANIKLIPTPSSSDTLKLWYIPMPAKITSSAQTIDGVAGWEEYIILDCTVEILKKQDLDATPFERDQMVTMQRIVQAASQRDAGLPQTITDSHAVNDIEPFFLV